MMNYPKAIVIAAVLIAGAIAFSVRAQAGPGGRYQVSAGSKNNAWRINVETGHMVACDVAIRARVQRVSCYDANGDMDVVKF